jgi:hypothetical protein
MDYCHPIAINEKKKKNEKKKEKKRKEKKKERKKEKVKRSCSQPQKRNKYFLLFLC